MAEAFDLSRWFPAVLSPPSASRIGGVLASAATIAITHPVHHVSGTAAISFITPPDPAFQGEICLIADAIWTWIAAGGANSIGIAGTVTAAGKAVYFTYDATTKIWYPDKIA